MMGDPAAIVGRVAGLNGSYVSVTSYKDETAEVLPLRIPNEPLPATLITAPAADLVFYPTNLDSTLMADATVYDLSENGIPTHLLDKDGVWVISSSCHVFGAFKVVSENGKPHPVTSIKNEIKVVLTNPNDTVVFEDVLFCAPPSSQ